MGRRGPKPSDTPGETVGVHVDGVTLAHLNAVTASRSRTRSFIGAEAVRLGLPLVEKLYPEVRKVKRAAKSKAGAKSKARAKSPAAETLKRK